MRKLIQSKIASIPKTVKSVGIKALGRAMVDSPEQTGKFKGMEVNGNFVVIKAKFLVRIQTPCTSTQRGG